MPDPSADQQSCNGDALSLYRKILPPEFFESVRQTADLRENNRVYTLPVVMWLMPHRPATGITQRLGAKGRWKAAYWN